MKGDRWVKGEKSISILAQLWKSGPTLIKTEEMQIDTRSVLKQKRHNIKTPNQVALTRETTFTGFREIAF